MLTFDPDQLTVDDRAIYEKTMANCAVQFAALVEFIGDLVTRARAADVSDEVIYENLLGNSHDQSYGSGLKAPHEFMRIVRIITTQALAHPH